MKLQNIMQIYAVGSSLDISENMYIALDTAFKLCLRALFNIAYSQHCDQIVKTCITLHDKNSLRSGRDLVEPETFVLTACDLA